MKAAVWGEIQAPGHYSAPSLTVKFPITVYLAHFIDTGFDDNLYCTEKKESTLKFVNCQCNR